MAGPPKVLIAKLTPHARSVQPIMLTSTIIQHIEVTIGTTVTWTNQDTVPHTVAFSPVVLSSSNSWESGLLYPGQSFTYYFTSSGAFQYHCQEHPFEMIGTVNVT